MNSRSFFLLILGLLLSCAFVASAAAQDGHPRYSPERLERKTEAGEGGKLGWAKFEMERCRGCSGTGKIKCKTCERLSDDASCPDCKRKGKQGKREAVCRTCVGNGSLPDPLEKVHCPGCSGAAFLMCTVCNGGGRLKVDGAKRFSACPSCRGKGGFPCSGCSGKRHVAGATFKPSLAATEDAKKVQKALDVTEKILKELAAFNPKGGPKGRKEAKALAKIIKSGAKVHPAFKTLEKQIGKYMGKIFAGKQFIGAAENEMIAMGLLKANAEYYLKMQKRMFELTLKRIEANAKIGGK